MLENLKKDLIAMLFRQSICTKVAVFQIKIPIFARYINYLVIRKMSLRKLNSFVLIAILALAAVSCKKNNASTVYPSLSGLSFECPFFVAPNQVVTMTPKGVVHPDGEEVGYYWKVSPSMSVSDTVDVFTHKFSDTLATYSVACYAFASGYSGSSYVIDVVVVKGGLDQSITKTGIVASDPNVVMGNDVYYYCNVAGLDWFRNNLCNDSYGAAYVNEEVTSDVFGRYYSYEEAKTACPEGWRLPTEQDWLDLCESVGATSLTEYATVRNVASKLFVSAEFNGEPMLEYWPAVGDITNASGVGLLPVGYANLGEKNASGVYSGADFQGMNEYAVFWTADVVDGDPDMAYYRYLIGDQPDFYVGKGDRNSFGASVRCVRD